MGALEKGRASGQMHRRVADVVTTFDNEQASKLLTSFAT